MAVFPAGTAVVGVSEETRKGGSRTPVPVANMTWGLPAPVSVMVMAPILPIPAEGVKVTEITQFVAG